MSIFNFSGDIHGRSCIGAPRIVSHHRQINYDFGFVDLSRFGVLDNVGPDLAACIDTSDIRDFAYALVRAKERTEDVRPRQEGS